MPQTSNSIDVKLLVGRYIRSTCPSTLETYLRETGLTEDDLNTDLPDLRTILEAYQSTHPFPISSLTQQLSSTHLDSIAPIASGSHPKKLSPAEQISQLLEKKIPGTSSTSTGASRDASGSGGVLSTVERSLDGISGGNLLGVWVEKLPRRKFDTSAASYIADYTQRILVTSVDKSLKIIDYESGEVEEILQPHRAAILSVAVNPVERRYICTGSMDGSAILTDLITSTPLQTLPHTKFVVRTSFSPSGSYLCTASYSRHIILYAAYHAPPTGSEPDLDPELLDETDDPLLAREGRLRFKEVWRVETKSNPEAVVFTQRHLIYTVRGSHLMFFVELPPSPPPASSSKEVVPPTIPEGYDFPTYTKSFNATLGDTHLSFAVLNLALHPLVTQSVDGIGLIACQTGDHAGHSGERILLYSTDVNPAHAENPSTSASAPTSVAGIGSADEGRTSIGRMVGGGEDGERLRCLWTGEEGDKFVLPRMCWLPDGSGIISTTTTGHLILLDLHGKTHSRLKVHGGIINGQEISGVVRDVAMVGEADKPETWRVVSVGYDGRVRISR